MRLRELAKRRILSFKFRLKIPFIGWHEWLHIIKTKGEFEFSFIKYLFIIFNNEIRMVVDQFLNSHMRGINNLK